jgi:hypothetical protein
MSLPTANESARVLVADIYYDATMRIQIALVSLGLWFNRRLISRFTFLTCIEHKQDSHFFSYDQTR